MLKDVTFGEVVGAVLVVAALLAVVFLAVVAESPEAAGAIIVVLSTGAGFFLRGRLKDPTKK